MNGGYVDPLDALASSMGLDIDTLVPAQKTAKLNFKTHVDLNEIYGEFYMDLAELLVQVVGAEHTGEALEDYSTIAPTIFGDLVRGIFKPGSGSMMPLHEGETGKVSTLTRLRQYFPTVTQTNGLAQELLEKTSKAVGQTISRCEQAADTRLRGQYGYTVDIIHSHYPEPFISVSGEGAMVTIYGEVWDKTAAEEEPLSEEEFDEDELELHLGATDLQPLGFTGTGLPLNPITEAIVKANEPVDLFSLLDSAPTRF